MRAKDLPKRRGQLDNLSTEIDKAVEAARNCVATAVIEQCVDKELVSRERFIFRFHDFGTRSMLQSRAAIRRARRRCQSLAGFFGHAVDPQFVALLGKLLLAEHACRTCQERPPKTVECEVSAILDTINIKV